MSYTGAWRRDRATRSDGSGLTVAASPLGHPELAELHMTPEPDVDGSRPPWAAQDGEEVPAYLTDLGRPYNLNAARAPGLVLDTEPTDDHDDGVTLGGGQSYAEARAEGHAARTRDRGAAERSVYLAARSRGADEVRTTERVEVTPINAGSRVFALRGDNSLPENNPDGFRNGLRVQRWTERRIPGTSRREHNAYPARTRTAKAPNYSPAAAAGTTNRYASPFGLNQISRVRVMAAPMARRTPRAWDEDVISDGTEAAAPSYLVWGL